MDGRRRQLYLWWKRYKYLIGIFISLLVCLLILCSSYLWPIVFNTFEHKSLDCRFRWLSDPQDARDDIVIINVDEESIKVMEPLFGRWPWPRGVHAMLIHYLSLAKAIAFDVLFTEKSGSIVTKDQVEDASQMIKRIQAGDASQLEDLSHLIALLYQHNDEFLAQAMADVPKVYLADIFLPQGAKDLSSAQWIEPFSLPYNQSLSSICRFDQVTPPLKEFCQTVKGVGHINVMPDEDGPVRRALTLINFNQRLYPSLSMRLLIDLINPKKIEIRPGDGLYLDSLRIPIDQQGKMLINYLGGFGTYKYYPYWLIIYSYNQMSEGDRPVIPREVFKDKIILIGSTAGGLMDLRVNPFSPVYPGVEIHANIIDNVLSNSFLSRPSDFVNLLVMLIFSLVIGLLVPRLKPIIGAVFTLEVLILYGLVAIYFFNYHRLWLEVFRPFLVIISSYLFILVYRYITVDKEQKRTKQAFSHYVNASVVEEILKDPEKLKLWGEDRVLTVLFSDIRGFTTISEQMEPQDVVSLLNEYLEVMTRVVFKYDGTLDKYVGDEIMAIFGAPLNQTDHAYRACLTALEMMKELKQLNLRLQSQGKPQLNIGIGINTGKMVVGNIGSELKKDYTVIGDNVNLGARLEGTNKEFGTNIIISEFTYQLIISQIKVRELGNVIVKGKQKPVRIYELVGLA